MNPKARSIKPKEFITIILVAREEGFKKLGHTISSENPDLIFSNDPRGYDKSLILKITNPSAILIFNVLDIPWHMPNIEKQTHLLVKHYLSKADFVTVISFKVQKSLLITTRSKKTPNTAFFNNHLIVALISRNHQNNCNQPPG